MWASEKRAKDERAKTATEMNDFIFVNIVVMCTRRKMRYRVLSSML